MISSQQYAQKTQRQDMITVQYDNTNMPRDLKKCSDSLLSANKNIIFKEVVVVVKLSWTS